MAFIAGPYTVTYNSLALGILEDAPSLEMTGSVDPIVGDNYGDSVQDGVYRGGNLFFDMVLQEYNAAGAAAAFWPYAALGTMGQVGRMISSMAQGLVFTAVAGTTASALPATITAPNTILAPNFPVRLLFGSRLRNVPLRFQCLPYYDSGATANRWFVTT